MPIDDKYSHIQAMHLTEMVLVISQPKNASIPPQPELYLRTQTNRSWVKMTGSIGVTFMLVTNTDMVMLLNEAVENGLSEIVITPDEGDNDNS